jgi:hypothetical protein
MSQISNFNCWLSLNLNGISNFLTQSGFRLSLIIKIIIIKYIIFDDIIRLRAQPIISLIYQLKTCYKLFKTLNKFQYINEYIHQIYD